MSFTADFIEQAALSIFQKPGWRYEDLANLASDGPDKRRASSGEAALSGLLQQAARRINPHIPQETLLLALKQAQATETPSLIEENRRIHLTLPGFISAACSRRRSTCELSTGCVFEPDRRDWHYETATLYARRFK